MTGPAFPAQPPVGLPSGPSGVPGPALPHWAPTSTRQPWTGGRVILNVLGFHALATPMIGLLGGITATWITAEGFLSGFPDALLGANIPLPLLLLVGGIASAMLSQPIGAVVGLIIGFVASMTWRAATPAGSGAVAALVSPFVTSPLLLVLPAGIWLLFAVPASLAAFVVVRHVTGRAQRDTAEAEQHGPPQPTSQQPASHHLAPQQGWPQQAWPHQADPQQGIWPQQSAPPQTWPQQGWPQQSAPPQTWPQQPAPQPWPQQHAPQQPDPQQGWPEQQWPPHAGTPSGAEGQPW